MAEARSERSTTQRQMSRGIREGIARSPTVAYQRPRDGQATAERVRGICCYNAHVVTGSRQRRLHLRSIRPTNPRPMGATSVFGDCRGGRTKQAADCAPRSLKSTTSCKSKSAFLVSRGRRRPPLSISRKAEGSAPTFVAPTSPCPHRSSWFSVLVSAPTAINHGRPCIPFPSSDSDLLVQRRRSQCNRSGFF